VGAENLDGHGAKVVEDLNLGGPTGFVLGQNARPKGETGVVAEFDFMKSQSDGFLQQRGSV